MAENTPFRMGVMPWTSLWRRRRVQQGEEMAENTPYWPPRVSSLTPQILSLRTSENLCLNTYFSPWSIGRRPPRGCIGRASGRLDGWNALSCSTTLEKLREDAGEKVYRWRGRRKKQRPTRVSLYAAARSGTSYPSSFPKRHCRARWSTS